MKYVFANETEYDDRGEWMDEPDGSTFDDFKRHCAGAGWSQQCDDRPEIVRTIEQIVERDGQYRTLKGRDRDIARQYYTRRQCQNVPYMNPALQAPGKHFRVLAHDGTLIANRYERVVVGDHGAYVEVDPAHLSKQVAGMMQYGTSMRGAKNTRFNVEQPKCEVYRQDERVQFADFAIGMYYMKLSQVKFESAAFSKPSSPVKSKLPPVSSGVAKKAPPKAKKKWKRKRGQPSLEKFFLAPKSADSGETEK